MSKTILDGWYTQTTPSDGIHTNPGILRGYLINCTSGGTTTATCTFYDNTTATGTVLLAVQISGHSPHYVMFPRDHAIAFSTGLSLTLSNCTVAIWSEDFG